MNRLWLLTGGTVLALFLIGLGSRDPSGTTQNTGPVGRIPVTAKVTQPEPAVVEEPVKLTKAEQFERLQELVKTGPVTPDIPEGLRRFGGKKAIQPLFELMRSTDDYRIVGACAVALQDYHDVSLMPDILARLDELGLLQDSARMPWLSKRMLTEYFKTNPDQTLALKAVKTRPTLGDPDQPVVQAQAPVEHKP